MFSDLPPLLILVIMEDTLRVRDVEYYQRDAVLILVLMEGTLREYEQRNIIQR